MNTSALKPFAQRARRILRESVERRLIYWGFDAKGNNAASVESVKGGYTFRGKVSDDASVPGKWNKLKTAISNTSFDEVVEKASYTWFNRLLALKILSKNGYETAQLDYLTDETKTPAILERARRGQYAFLNSTEQQRLQFVLTDYEKEQEAFAVLLIGYCHQHPLLQSIFGSIDDYTELLLPDDILNENGFLYFLNTTEAITEEDYKQVELIGWLYQFYISEKKDEVFAGFKQNKKAEAKDIPAATQIFTPNWIVKYMVQNTLGRTWLDAHPDSDLKVQWKYLVKPSEEKSITTTTIVNLETLNFLDPAVGSGHILVEAFDTFYPMYLAEFYSPDEAVQSILQNNLFGLDLDTRAAQLAQFALIIKSAQYSRTVLQGKLLPHVYAMPQPRVFTKEEVKIFLGEAYISFTDDIYNALQTMEQANNLGSIMVLTLSEDAHEAVQERGGYWKIIQAQTFEEGIVKEVFPLYIPILLILTTKFVCIAANPPYMGQKNMNAELKNYVNQYYSISKNDLMTVFIDMFGRLISKNGRYGFITPPSWMFLSSYEELRNKLINSFSINSLLHLSRGVFGADFGSVATIIQNVESNSNTSGTYFKLIERTFQEFHHRHLEELFSMALENPKLKFLFTEYDKDSENLEHSEKGIKINYPNFAQVNFKKIPGTPIAYWVSEKFLLIFEKSKSLEHYAEGIQGMITGDNNKFVRNWQEIAYTKGNFWISEFADMENKPWVPYLKGGAIKKWYGNFDHVVNWSNGGNDFVRNRSVNKHLYLKEGITWNFISSGSFTGRFFPNGCIWDVAGSSIFPSHELIFPFLGLMCSHVGKYILNLYNPTINYQVEDVLNLPIFEEIISENSIVTLVKKCINFSKIDWNSRETSWDFESNPLVSLSKKNLEEAYQQWLLEVSKLFFELQGCEEELNKIFLKIYGLDGEFSAYVPLSDITILQGELDYKALEQLTPFYDTQLVPVSANIIMQQLISYTVGCYMGRYRLDKPGLHIAHPNPTEEELKTYSITTGLEKYFIFQIDDDAIIPFMGSSSNFTDDMLYRINEFLSIVWGDDTLTANLNFLQQKLGKDLEDYLVKDFWKDHVRTYSKKPIYWLFTSKKGAFQVLVYMHRMNAFTTANIRSKYLIPHISWLKNQLNDMEKNAATLSKSELKKLDIIRKQVIECEEYDLLLKDIADKQINFDLDDGVTRNYALFEGVVAPIK